MHTTPGEGPVHFSSETSAATPIVAKPSITLSMIVKNEGKVLRACLESAHPLVDQIVIADTGCTDNTLEIAREFGAVLLSSPWNNSFAEARNAALGPVTSDWVLVLDADEELAPDAIAAIPKLLQRAEGVGGYLVTIRNFVPDKYTMTFGRMSRENIDGPERAKAAPAYTEHAMLRLFRRHPAIAFTGRIHEGVDRQIEALGLRIEEANFKIFHFGHLIDAESQKAKNDFYLQLGRSKVEEDPENSLAWFELGTEEYKQKNYDRALLCMETSCRLRPSSIGFFFIAKIHAAEQRNEAALKVLGFIKDTGDMGLMKNHTKGDVLHAMGNLKEARRAYALALELSQHIEDAHASGQQSIVESKLGYTEIQLGKIQTGLKKLLHAREKNPKWLEVHDRLVKAYVQLGREAEAADAAEAILEHFLSEKILLRAIALRMRLQQLDRAQRLLEIGLHLFPESEALRRIHGEQPIAVEQAG